MKKFLGLMSMAAVLCMALSVVSVPTRASGGSGAGGGGGNTTATLRVVGYVTAVDYVNSKITVGQS